MAAGRWTHYFMAQPLGILDEHKSPLRIRPLHPQQL